jgi:hypothetical protein
MGRYVASFLTRRITLANGQFGPLKLSAITLGIILGAYFADFWKPDLRPEDHLDALVAGQEPQGCRERPVEWPFLPRSFGVDGDEAIGPGGPGGSGRAWEE